MSHCGDEIEIHNISSYIYFKSTNYVDMDDDINAKKKNYIKPSNNWPTGTRPNPFHVIVLAYTKANPILKQTGLASL